MDNYFDPIPNTELGNLFRVFEGGRFSFLVFEVKVKHLQSYGGLASPAVMISVVHSCNTSNQNDGGNALIKYLRSYLDNLELPCIQLSIKWNFHSCTRFNSSLPCRITIENDRISNWHSTISFKAVKERTDFLCDFRISNQFWSKILMEKAGQKILSKNNLLYVRKCIDESFPVDGQFRNDSITKERLQLRLNSSTNHGTTPSENVSVINPLVTIGGSVFKSIIGEQIDSALFLLQKINCFHESSNQSVKEYISAQNEYAFYSDLLVSNACFVNVPIYKSHSETSHNFALEYSLVISW
ncbi:hypothetical protein Bhyg_14883 [Pseudolycoriella hygida]|uniref:Uncharacterized protein n=1 Tax=Pseudolycoriella hygida TaxID=35572 RepID=A0A9Q0RW18_9DIPT|nr:hypothetical protein Bhyg_14883 [Pseudolycoriella hygida]